jgi:hypothetical protein
MTADDQVILFLLQNNKRGASNFLCFNNLFPQLKSKKLVNICML